MTIPLRTARAHYMPYWYGDSLAAIDRCAAHARRKRRRGYIDQNVNLSRDDVAMMLHWATIRKNGYRWRAVGGQRVRFNPPRNARVSDYPAAFLITLRRTPREGRSYASKVHPVTFNTAVAYAQNRNVVLCPELKAREFATNPSLAVKMFKFVQSQGATVYPMTLQSMVGWEAKLRNFHDAGFEVALLPRGRKPSRLLPFIRVWGRWRRR